MILINLKDIQDPCAYLYKHKLRVLALQGDAVNDIVVLQVPSGTSYEIARNISNHELVKLIEDLIDVTYDAMTTWADQRNIYLPKHSTGG